MKEKEEKVKSKVEEVGKVSRVVKVEVDSVKIFNT